MYRFIDDLDRWAALVSLDERDLFWEIASCLWGNRSSAATVADPDQFPHDEVLSFFQELVSNLVDKSGIFVGAQIRSPGGYRLRYLRQHYSHILHPTNEPDSVSSAEPCPWDQFEIWKEKCHTDAL